MMRPPYETHLQVGDTVVPKGGGVFARANNAATAKVLDIVIWNCPMEGPEWLAKTDAGDFFTTSLEINTKAPLDMRSGACGKATKRSALRLRRVRFRRRLTVRELQETVNPLVDKDFIPRGDILPFGGFDIAR